MKLVSVYEDLRRCRMAAFEGNCRLLYQLLQERKPEESISHKEMPTWEEHCTFVMSQPYLGWYLAWVNDKVVGACYLTHQREIGVSILLSERGHGYGVDAVQCLIAKFPGRFLANINPANSASLMMFRKLGFGGPIQVTLERPE